MLIVKFFIYFAAMIACGVSIVETDSLIVQSSLFVGVVVTFLLGLSAIKEVEEQQ